MSNHDTGNDGAHRRRPLQFSLRSMIVSTTAAAVLFAVLRAMNVPPRTGMIVLVILVVAVAAALGLIVAITAADGEE